MSEIQATGFVAPALDPCNAGVNAAGGVGDEVSNAAIVGAPAAQALENEGNSVGGALQLEPCATDPVEGKGGVEGDGSSQKRVKADNLLMCLSGWVVTKVNYCLVHFICIFVHVWIIRSLRHSRQGNNLLWQSSD
jgi:hypothetical protein